jgi:transcriptional regulator with XRE-family HTH domain
MPKRIGAEIQRIRGRKGWTQEYLAERANMSTAYLGFIEQGRKEPKIQTLKKIANALGVRVKDLITF